MARDEKWKKMSRKKNYIGYSFCCCFIFVLVYLCTNTHFTWTCKLTHEMSSTFSIFFVFSFSFLFHCFSYYFKFRLLSIFLVNAFCFLLVSCSWFPIRFALWRIEIVLLCIFRWKKSRKRNETNKDVAIYAIRRFSMSSFSCMCKYCFFAHMNGCYFSLLHIIYFLFFYSRRQNRLASIDFYLNWQKAKSILNLVRLLTFFFGIVYAIDRYVWRSMELCWAFAMSPWQIK